VSPATAGRSGVLAFTGSNLLPLTVIGAALLLTGWFLLAARKRHEDVL
jgi:LPXTG-motif cell wall-anchored protein